MLLCPPSDKDVQKEIILGWFVMYTIQMSEKLFKQEKGWVIKLWSSDNKSLIPFSNLVWTWSLTISHHDTIKETNSNWGQVKMHFCLSTFMSFPTHNSQNSPNIFFKNQDLNRSVEFITLKFRAARIFVFT